MTHLFSYCLLQLPNIWNPPDTVTHQEHPSDGQANLGVPHVPQLSGLLAKAGPREGNSINSLNLEKKKLEVQEKFINNLPVNRSLCLDQEGERRGLDLVQLGLDMSSRSRGILF